VQFQLDDAFITSMHIDLDGTAVSAGSTELVVAANAFRKVSPTSGPSCDCSSGLFFTDSFRVTIDGSAKTGVVSAENIGFTVPRLGTTTYSPGAPVFNAIRLAATTSTSPAATSTRNYFDAWSSSEATGIGDPRSGQIDLQSSALTQTLAQIDLIELEPVFPFDPMFVDGRQALTVRPAFLDVG
jgi:hypothetical protein